MKKLFFVSVLIVAVCSCTKEQPESTKPESTSATELEALKQEIKALREKVESLTPAEPGQWAPASELEALKQENVALKAKVEKLSSTFFEVDGLWFDHNGDIISTPKKPSSQTTDENKYRFGMHTSTRTYDSEGRLMETYDEYNQIGLSYFTPPFYWQKVTYDYKGKTCKKTTQTNNQPVAGQYEEEITETEYW